MNELKGRLLKKWCNYETVWKTSIWKQLLLEDLEVGQSFNSNSLFNCLTILLSCRLPDFLKTARRQIIGNWNYWMEQSRLNFKFSWDFMMIFWELTTVINDLDTKRSYLSVASCSLYIFIKLYTETELWRFLLLLSWYLRCLWGYQENMEQSEA